LGVADFVARGGSNLPRTMNKSLGFELVVFSVLLAGLSYLTHHLAPAIARPVLIAGMAGGALSLVWGLLALFGKCGKVLPVLTLLPVCYVMLWQTVVAWIGRTAAGPDNRFVPVTITVALALAVVMLLNIIHAGVTPDGKPLAPVKESGKPAPPEKKDASADRCR
jgi:hypothetical protein